MKIKNEDINRNTENKKLKKYEILNIPNEMVIKDHHYIFIKELTGDKFSYRYINYNLFLLIHLVLLLILQ